MSDSGDHQNERQGRALRVIAALVAWVLLTLMLWAIYAAPRWTALTGEQTALPLSGFRVDGGEGHPGVDSLDVAIAAAAPRTLVWSVGPWQASDHRFLRIRLDGLGQDRALRLWWRRDGKPDSVAIPRAGDVVTLDLVRASAGWTGRIDDLAIEVRPVDLLAAEDAPAMSLTLREVSLLGDGYVPALAAMGDEWAAQRRWTGRSINTSGLELDLESPRPWLPAFLLAALLLWPALGWALRWRHGAWLRGGGLIALGLWLLLDLQSLRLQAARAARVATVHELAGDAGLAASPALARPLTALRDELLAEASPPTVFLHGKGAFLRDYPMFVLRPLNVGPLPKSTDAPLPGGSVVIALGKPLPLENGQARIAGMSYHVTELRRAPGMQALRLTGSVADPSRDARP